MKIGSLHILLVALVACSACTAEAGDEPLDGRDDMFAGPKADGFCVEPGSAEAAGILAYVNDPSTTAANLDNPPDHREPGAGLNRLAAEGIVAARPFVGTPEQQLSDLDAVYYVGNHACRALRSHVCERLGRCAGACDPDAFDQRPRYGRFTESCVASFWNLRSAVGASVTDAEVDIADRCTQLSDVERRAFDWAIGPIGYSPAEAIMELGEFGLDHEVRQTNDGRFDIITIDSWDDGTRTTVVFENDASMFMLDDDGLSVGETWTCGAEGEDSIEPPWGRCTYRLMEPPCAPGSVQESAVTIAADDLAEAQPLSIRYAVRHYRAANGGASDAPIEAALSGCDARWTVALEAAGYPDASYETWEEEDGAFLLTVSDDAGQTTVLCDYDFPAPP